MCLDVDGEIWVPMEITLIGKAVFMEAWRKGMEERTAYDAKPESRRFYSTKEPWQRYRPVGLKETDLGLHYGRREAIMDGFRKDRDTLIELVTGNQLSAAQQSGKKQDWNKSGIMLAKFLQYGKAEGTFERRSASMRAMRTRASTWGVSCSSSRSTPTRSRPTTPPGRPSRGAGTRKGTTCS